VPPSSAAMSAADAFVTAYAGYDWRHPDGDPGSWRGLVTPDLFARLTGPSASSSGMTPAQTAAHEVATPHVTATTWEEGTVSTAEVLVDCTLVVAGDGEPQQSTPTPYPLTLTHDGDHWLVSAVGGGGGGGGGAGGGGDGAGGAGGTGR
ncbi:MAG TPA: hypothetical protein VFH45_07575, partial [Acidimicrobiales bacterium]|nr:hypothetical protein [Acidimicrobiales bacterium]